ncbi:tRNA (N(6)-L-threonylcarbamoyladenosine(37)-C(2))-methylthiotransferase MtaB [Sphingomonadales bacterium 56]|uniref:tRNA (N(6)-L-threonylcarbamoyladenosine(37)-C(2))- methylthiotransferase MtaB n=1 Tax=unclassified Sphingobium TaxID=2611147 RepID=UPI00191AD7EC|nr:MULTISPECIES: tRNA (N(6)-L-threonylcarbamoyladenosine(37)-C(2))-methylthiotransferase MtaB [unclassified Sphingobium]MBY2928541.1 tRNA (N(6)-L-threonylcarbamoyladenosine(37)-C(2))-methylthiotransferase MtaB [Sphingomonadales bacterium 56]MBY2959611.1 tRNA (N(6)-L-threonylcarbamoyladenosine(37)-C(2))-methylthiotransferase MtaB [Sphingomonadales bacterium 58]CAD7337517.1 Threonylcarbamoyladenosine tRNA methylthiotransferase MtaB [Sphingobium sp. S6]CAD7339341.1 Threonylcarbamoyladenosine tRNA 
MSGPQIITLGCRLNIAESEAIREMAGEQDDLIVVNSCAVTAEAVRQTRQAIRRARRERPEARIMVTGCAAQTEPETFAQMTEVDAVIGNREKLDPFHYPSSRRTLGSQAQRRAPPHETPASAGVTEVLKAAEKVQVSDIMAVRDTAPHMASAFAEHARAFLEVQNGCDHRCTFCIIPYGRGNSRSVPAGAVIDKARELVDAGYQEIVLTGVDVTSYGPDLPGSPSLGLLVERILKAVPALPRLRLSSIDSVEIDDRLFELLAHEPRMMPHLHLSLQAGDDMILKRMKRRHMRTDAIRIVERLKTTRPAISIGADIIAGFPTEDEAMFENSLKLVEECAIVHGHIFPYSPRAGTPAARMPQVDRAIIKARAARLRSACEARRREWLQSLIGSTQSVLVERNGLSGHAENFAPVRFEAPQSPSSITSATITGLENGVLIAQEARQ